MTEIYNRRETLDVLSDELLQCGFGAIMDACNGSEPGSLEYDAALLAHRRWASHIYDKFGL